MKAEFGRVEPMDQHNQSLLANVHPADWANPEPADRYNLVVIGAGTAGLVTAAALREAEQFGVKIPSGIEVDFVTAMERMRRLRSRISKHDSAARLRSLGVDVFLGQGRFAGAGTVQADDKMLRFSKAFIATGARPVEPSMSCSKFSGALIRDTLPNPSVPEN